MDKYDGFSPLQKCQRLRDSIIGRQFFRKNFHRRIGEFRVSLKTLFYLLLTTREIGAILKTIEQCS